MYKLNFHMRYTFTLLMTALLFVACQPEDPSQELTSASLQANALTDATNIGEYKGVFTTLDSKYRAVVSINIPANGNTFSKAVPVATLTTHTGESFEAKAVSIPQAGNAINNLHFASAQWSFDFSVNQRGETPQVTNVIFKDLDADIIVAKHTQRAPVTPVTGTWECVECNGHPVVGQGATQTFNMMFTTADGTSNMTTQSTIGTTTTDGIGYQSDCSATGVLTTCTIESGDGSTTNVGFLSNGQPVTWEGVHIFNNEPTSSGNDCSQITGAWEWESISYGTLSGTFESDTSCPGTNTTLIDEDFEDATFDFVPTFVDNAGETTDYFRITDGSDISAAISGVQGAQFFGAQDIDGVTAVGVNPASLTWSGFDVSGLTNFDFSAFFAEDDDGSNQDWDELDYLRAQYRLDGGPWVTFFAIENDGTEFNTAPLIDNDLDGDGDGAEITDTMTQYGATFAIPAATTMDIRIEMSLDAGDEDIAIDNVLLTGN